mgnify:CR=1 FL=1
MAQAKIRVAVLMGGPSSEYEISLATGRKIISALDTEKYLVQPVVVTKERKWLIPPPSALLRSPGQENGPMAGALVVRDEDRALDEMRSGGVDLAFIAMHGEFGEDGTVQGLLEAIGIAYTGSGVLASALGMDKPKSLAVFRDAGLRVPDFSESGRQEWERSGEAIGRGALETFGLPLVIKPANRGSSVGVSIVSGVSEIEPAAAKALAHSERIMFQKYIAGDEVTCGVLETETDAVPLQPTQIIPKEGSFFDYHCKYTPGASEEITPPRLAAETIRRIQETGLRAHRAIGASGMSRTDMILAADGTPYVLEINTIPGMTETSLLPQAAQAVGISFPELLDTIIRAALRTKLQ